MNKVHVKGLQNTKTPFSSSFKQENSNVVQSNAKVKKTKVKKMGQKGLK